MSLETNPSSRVKILWRQIKPFIRGKIPYAPNTPLVQRIIKRVRYVLQTCGGRAGGAFTFAIFRVLV